MFAKIKEAIPKTLATTNTSSVVFHGTHLDEVLDICQGTNAIFKGNLKQWRLLDDDCYNEEYCSYLVRSGKPPEPMKPNNCTPFGPFVWFGTKRDETDKYGPCQFEFNFTSVLRAYQTCRNSEKEICYRVAGTLVYKQEVCHIVMVCCKGDRECQSYPLITNNNTCYFTPPNFPSDNNSTPADSQFQTKINDYQRRHEHVTFALYLPNNRRLYLSYRDGRMKLTPHNTYCIASRSRECLFKEDQLPISIDQLKIITKWISNAEEKEEINEPVVEYNPLDQSLEDSFDWLSSADETEYFGNEGDRHDFDNYNELGFDDFSNDYDNFTSDWTVTTSSDSSTSSSNESEDYY